ncbi:MAG: hypothetical protein M1818_003598 [Claussenomyces sp. TS43310]|nr:MAG: hypothetical protein M1818_003598 [Claussenomyces sp. TS43310]
MDFARSDNNRQWRGAGRTAFSTKWRASPQPPLKPLGATIDSINASLLLVEEEAPKITKLQYVSSYNWLDSRSSVILVPGSPPTWTPPVGKQQLQPDRGDVFRDINSAKHPTFPMEPAVRAIFAMQPDFDLGQVDVMACGSTMGNLLRFARSDSKPFTFDVDCINDTVFFIRKERSPTELITDLRGYGHTFPEAYTTWEKEVRHSCSHQRIVEYDFSGLHFVIRSETDGYVGGNLTGTATKGDFAIEDALERMAVATANGNARPPVDNKLVLKMQGTKVPQDQIFDIKTRSKQTNFSMNDILPRLWINQTSKFLLAYHERGLFDAPQVMDIQQEVLEWQNDNAEILARFHELIKRVVDVVRDSADQRVEVSWDGQGPLIISTQLGDEKRVLPTDLLDTLESV